MKDSAWLLWRMPLNVNWLAAVRESASVRTAIPMHAARKLGLKPGIRLKRDTGEVDGESTVVARMAQSVL